MVETVAPLIFEIELLPCSKEGHLPRSTRAFKFMLNTSTCFYCYGRVNVRVVTKDPLLQVQKAEANPSRSLSEIEAVVTAARNGHRNPDYRRACTDILMELHRSVVSEP